LSTVAALGAFARDCARCRLRAGCRQVVFGEGPEDAGLVLIGEGPGANEDEQGRPFCGRAGELLDRILAAAGFRREDVYVSNVVLCRPPGNRTPADDEVAACRPWLERRLELLRPRVVVALGATAVRALVHPKARITQVRGQWHRRGDAWVMPTFHPAALLRDPGKKRPVWEDFQQVRDVYRRLAAPAAGPPA
jgi:uracil-DNA glycosylase family 4